jgi:signal transduction histidine kinase
MDDLTRPKNEAAHQLPASLMHDLRTPLNHIIGYSELMIDEAREAGHTGYMRHLEKVIAAARHLELLMDVNFRSYRSADSHDTAVSRPEEV